MNDYVNPFDETRRAVRQAESQLRAADNIASDCARLLKGRMRKVPGFLLEDLKRELRDFDMRTNTWKK